MPVCTMYFSCLLYHKTSTDYHIPVSYTHLDVYKRQADGKKYILGGRNTYNYFLGDFPGHKNYDRDVLVVCDEPEKENSVNQLLEYFETIWEQEDSDYFHDNKKLARCV